MDAIQQLQAQGFIGIERRGTPREPTVYSYRPISDWRGRQASLTTGSKVGLTNTTAKTLPEVVKFSEAGSQVPQSATPHKKKDKRKKETFLKKGSDPGIGFFSFSNPLNPPPLGDFPPPNTTGVTQGASPPVFGEFKRWRDGGRIGRIVVFLSKNGGPHSVAQISHALGEESRGQIVRNALSEGKRRGILVNAGRGLWVLGDGQPRPKQPRSREEVEEIHTPDGIRYRVIKR